MSALSLHIAVLCLLNRVQKSNHNVSSCHLANNLRGDDESRELQTVIYGSDSRGRGRGRGQDLYIVEEDTSDRTIDCADDTAEEFEDDFRRIYIVDDDDDARDGDVVAVIDRSTNCKRLWLVPLSSMFDTCNSKPIISLQ